MIDAAHAALAASNVDSYADAPIPELIDTGEIVCTNRFTPEQSRFVVLARGYQSRKDDDLPMREVYAVAKMVPGAAAVREDAVLHVLLRSAVLPYPAWIVGERLYIDGAGIDAEVNIKGRRWQAEKTDWEFLLFEWGEWETKQVLDDTYDIVVSMDVIPESDDEEEEDDDDEATSQ